VRYLRGHVYGGLPAGGGRVGGLGREEEGWDGDVYAWWRWFVGRAGVGVHCDARIAVCRCVYLQKGISHVNLQMREVIIEKSSVFGVNYPGVRGGEILVGKVA
jgi:hypothetical protein